jgi:hypothetical protein
MSEQIFGTDFFKWLDGVMEHIRNLHKQMDTQGTREILDKLRKALNDNRAYRWSQLVDELPKALDALLKVYDELRPK